MKENSNVFWAAVFGALLGGATVSFLNTKDGRKMTKRAKRKFRKLEKEGIKLLEKQSDILVKKAKKAVDSTRELIEDVTEKAKFKMDELIHMPEDSRRNFGLGEEESKNSLSVTIGVIEESEDVYEELG